VAPPPRSTGRPPTSRLRVEALEARDTPAFAFTTIDVPGASLTDINGINNSGQVVGTYTAGGISHGFLLSNGIYTTLDVPGATATVAWDINDSGQIAGSYTAGGTTHGFLLSDGTYSTIDVPGATRTMPRGIGDSGTVVGEYTTDGTAHGFVLDAGTVTPIDVPGAAFTSYASEINDAGEIVGRFDLPGTNSGYLLSAGTYTTLTFPGATSSAALGINDSGEVLGGYTAGGIRHGFLLRDGTYTPFDVPGATFTTPRKINDSGLIAGGYGAGTTTHGFLATAEPPARVGSVVVNDGSAQRSRVTSLTVTFGGLVTLDAGAFELRREDGSLIALNVATLVRGGHTAAVLTFAGSDVIAGSLADGNYSLTIRGDAVRDRVGRALDGDGDGLPGGDWVGTLVRLFGDTDGDADVDYADLDVMLSTFRKGQADPGFLWFLDFDGDGDVDGRDMAQFNHRRGH
jgi:hypothetical protein